LNKNILVTGSAGLIGGEAVDYFCRKGYKVTGIDNDFRAIFFGSKASTKWNTDRLLNSYSSNYSYENLDIRDYKKIEKVFMSKKFELIIHTAAQPSHDWAAKNSMLDFSINANGTHNLLELTRIYQPEATFIFTSTNKVYGDSPNQLEFNELDSRFEIQQGHKFWNGITEEMTVDNSTHSLFGVSKLAADLLTQEYGRYYGLNTAVFRGGCLTGPTHSAAELHGFLGYLVKCIVNGEKYSIFGYKGKQVRDNIHAKDLIAMFFEFHQNPKKGAIYNAGGGRNNSVSILEAIELIESISGIKASVEYVNENRIGDHIWYISNLSKFKSDYPNWSPMYSITEILSEMVSESKKEVSKQTY
jgi:CDP-paratose 2-epimerase